VKLRITFKDPDAVYQSDITLQIANCLASLPLTVEEKTLLVEVRSERITSELTDRFFRYGEYVDLEIDTESWDIKVVPVKEQKD
jgi:hypothetical protein